MNMKKQIWLLLWLSIAAQVFAAGKDIYGNDLTRTNQLGYVDGELTTVGDIADFATTGTSTNSVREIIDASFNGGTSKVNHVTVLCVDLSNRVWEIERNWANKQDKLPYATNAIPASVISDASWVTETITNGLATTNYVNDKIGNVKSYLITDGTNTVYADLKYVCRQPPKKGVGTWRYRESSGVDSHLTWWSNGWRYYDYKWGWRNLIYEANDQSWILLNRTRTISNQVDKLDKTYYAFTNGDTWCSFAYSEDYESKLATYIDTTNIVSSYAYSKDETLTTAQLRNEYAQQYSSNGIGRIGLLFQSPFINNQVYGTTYAKDANQAYNIAQIGGNKSLCFTNNALVVIEGANVSEVLYKGGLFPISWTNIEVYSNYTLDELITNEAVLGDEAPHLLGTARALYADDANNSNIVLYYDVAEHRWMMSEGSDDPIKDPSWYYIGRADDIKCGTVAVAATNFTSEVASGITNYVNAKSGLNTNAVGDLIRKYDETNLTARIDAKISSEEDPMFQNWRDDISAQFAGTAAHAVFVDNPPASVEKLQYGTYILQSNMEGVWQMGQDGGDFHPLASTDDIAPVAAAVANIATDYNTWKTNKNSTFAGKASKSGTADSATKSTKLFYRVEAKTSGIELIGGVWNLNDDRTPYRASCVIATDYDILLATNDVVRVITNGVAWLTNTYIRASNDTFSNEVLKVGIGIGTDEVAQINAILDASGKPPITEATTVGGLLVALAAAVAWLKRRKIDKLTCTGVADITTDGGTADLSSLFSADNTSLMGVVRYPINSAGTILDRNINVVSLGAFTIPAGFTDLLIRFSGTPVSLTFEDSGITDYGDDLPSESGDYLITVTKIDSDEAYIRVVTLEERT